PCPSRVFFFTLRRPPITTLFPSTTLFRSLGPRFEVRPLHHTIARRFGGFASAPGWLSPPQSQSKGKAVSILQGRVVLVTGASSGDRKSTRLNSSHVKISYAVFCLKKKTSR